LDNIKIKYPIELPTNNKIKCWVLMGLYIPEGTIYSMDNKIKTIQGDNKW